MANPTDPAQKAALRATGPPSHKAEQHVLPDLPPDQNELLKAFLMTAKEQRNLVPGLGLADTAYDPMKGLQAYNDEKSQRKRRVEIAMDKLGIKHTPVMARMDMSPIKAIMHARGIR